MPKSIKDLFEDFEKHNDDGRTLAQIYEDMKRETGTDLFGEDVGKEVIEDEPIEEALDMLVARPKEFFNSKLTIYRVTSEKLSIITPTFVSRGNKLNKVDFVSFWTDSLATCLRYGYGQTFVRRVADRIFETDGIKTKYRRDGNSRYCIHLNSPQEFARFKEAVQEVKFDFYIYETNIKGSDPALSIGHSPSIKEYTINRDVIPTKTLHVTKIDDKLFDEIFVFIDDLETFKNIEVKIQELGVIEKFLKKRSYAKDIILNTKGMYEYGLSLKDITKFINDAPETVRLVRDLEINKKMSDEEINQVAERLLDGTERVKAKHIIFMMYNTKYDHAATLIRLKKAFEKMHVIFVSITDKDPKKEVGNGFFYATKHLSTFDYNFTLKAFGSDKMNIFYDGKNNHSKGVNMGADIYENGVGYELTSIESDVVTESFKTLDNRLKRVLRQNHVGYHQREVKETKNKYEAFLFDGRIGDILQYLLNHVITSANRDYINVAKDLEKDQEVRKLINDIKNEVKRSEPNMEVLKKAKNIIRKKFTIAKALRD